MLYRKPVTFIALVASVAFLVIIAQSHSGQNVYTIDEKNSNSLESERPIKKGVFVLLNTGMEYEITDKVTQIDYMHVLLINEDGTRGFTGWETTVRLENDNIIFKHDSDNLGKAEQKIEKIKLNDLPISSPDPRLLNRITKIYRN